MKRNKVNINKNTSKIYKTTDFRTMQKEEERLRITFNERIHLSYVNNIRRTSEFNLLKII